MDYTLKEKEECGEDSRRRAMRSIDRVIKLDCFDWETSYLQLTEYLLRTRFIIILVEFKGKEK